MKLHLYGLAFAGAWLAMAPASALAWDAEGHRMIAHLVYERLTPKAKAAVAELVSHSAEQDTPTCSVASLDDASTWPDCVRPLPRFAYLAVMHYEDVPICGTAPKATYCPDGKCITDETRRASTILRDPQRSPVDRLQALEEVAHFIGDMHQPLHAADNADRGGNEVKVEVEGHASNLHHVWDTEILENAVGTSEGAAEASLRPLVAANAPRWSSGDVESWLFDGAYLTEVPGALWPMDVIDKHRIAERPELHRTVTAIDPSGSDGTGGDMQGIITVGLDDQNHAYVIADDSCRLNPNGWARKAIDAYHREGSDALVAEINYGGAMVESTIRAADPDVNFKPVNASRGKHIRAEPVAALYEQGKVHHVGRYSELEEQMGMMNTAGFQGGASPDRVDALVWAITELLLAPKVSGYAILELARRENAARRALTEPDPEPLPFQPGSLAWQQQQAAIAAAKEAAE